MFSAIDETVMKIMGCSRLGELFTIAGIFTASLVAVNCNPMYSIGVRGTLIEPLNVDCILNAAQRTEGVQHVLIHQNKPRDAAKVIKALDDIIDPPTTYLVTTIEQKDAQIEQRPLNDGQAMLWIGRRGFGIIPSRHTIVADQVFYVRLVSHIADVCKARFSKAITCIPASEACQDP